MKTWISMFKDKTKGKNNAEKQKEENFNQTPTDEMVEETQSEDSQSNTEPSEVDALKDKYLRLFAEFENYKKRTLRERIDLIKTASQDTIRKILPVLDDFDRAKKSADDENSKDEFPEGVTLVYQKLHKTMEGMGLKEMDMGDGQFDDDFHDAITHIPAASDDMSGKIIEVIEKGYLLNDKIIRHAKVVVGK